MANILPTVGGDEGTWGTKLNDYLLIEHNNDGTHNTGTGLVTEKVNTVAASSTAQTIPAPSAQTISDITLTATCAITLPTAVAGQSFTLVLRQDADGSRTVTYTGTIKWASAVAPTLTSTGNAVDVLSFICVVNGTWLGFIAGQDMK